MARGREEELLEVVEQPLQRGDAHYRARDGEDDRGWRSRPGIALPNLQHVVYQELQRPGLYQGDEADCDNPDQRRNEPAPVRPYEGQEGPHGHQPGPFAARGYFTARPP